MLIHAKIVYLNKPLSLIIEIKLKHRSALLIFTKKYQIKNPMMSSCELITEN